MQTPPFDRNKKNMVSTPDSYRKRCKDIPHATDMLWKVPKKANFHSMVKNYVLVIQWLMNHFKRKYSLAVAPSVTIEDYYNEENVTVTTDDQKWIKFARYAIFEKKFGVVAFVYKSNDFAHAIMSFVDARQKEKVVVYFIDPNGDETALDYDIAPIFKISRTWIQLAIEKWVLKPIGVKKNISTFMLKSPNVNFSKSSFMKTLDESNNYSFIETDKGFCQPWTFALMIDVLCAQEHVLSRDHFVRLYKRAGGGYINEQSRAYSRLMFLRATMSWIAEHMFDPNDRLYKTTIENWEGNAVFSSDNKQMDNFIVYRGDNIAFV